MMFIDLHYAATLAIITFSAEEWKFLLRKNTAEPEALVSFNNLNPNTEYQFRVIAVNSQGISEPSEPSDMLKTLSMLSFHRNLIHMYSTLLEVTRSYHFLSVMEAALYKILIFRIKFSSAM